MTSPAKTRTVLVWLLIAAAGLSSGCSVYFNTFFNAKKAFNEAEKTRESSSRGGGGKGQYQKAIEKALKVVEYHPNSKYYDDALFILGVSYFHTGQFSRAERRFRELIADHGDSKFAKESNVYLAKAKLELGDLNDALVIFEETFGQDYDRGYKSEAAMALGKHSFEAKEYEQSQQYFLAVRDSLGDDAQKLQAQIYIADGLFSQFKFQDALGAYLQVLGMDPDKDQRYHALFRSAICSYRLQRIDDGFDYLQELADDDLYYDSLGILKLTIAEGYEYDGDLLQAEEMYQEVANSTEKRRWEAAASYRLGLIYQFDYDRLEEAKAHYDRAVEAQRGSDIGLDALQRSSDIGKLETFARNPLDSNATVEAIDEAAYTQYLLAELLWLNLDKPDTAIMEMQYLVDSFPTSYYAPKAIIALSEMTREHLEDERAADSLLKMVLTKYPKSDYVPEAVSRLGLSGTVADTGYADLFIRRAEDFLVDAGDVDSARANYQYVVDHFPESKYHPRAKFALIWLNETYNSPGDSSVILAYQAFIDSFPGNILATEANRRISGTPQTAAATPQQQQAQGDEDSLGDTLFAEAGLAGDTAIEYLDPRLALYFRPNGDSLVDLRLEPIEIIEPFEFPAEAAHVDQHDWRLYFQLLIDFSGRVTDYVLKIPSGIQRIDELAELTVGSMTFDALSVSNRVIAAGLSEAPEGRGHWFVYEYAVKKPDYLR